MLSPVAAASRNVTRLGCTRLVVKPNIDCAKPSLLARLSTGPNGIDKSDHGWLFAHYRDRLAPPQCVDALSTAWAEVSLTRSRHLEERWLAHMRKQIGDVALPAVADFQSWFLHQRQCYHDRTSELISFLGDSATLTQLSVYIALEDAVDTGFDDLVAMSQTGVRHIPSKMVLADNYWDEMGSGQVENVHSTLFSESASFFEQHLQDKHVDLEQVRCLWQVQQNSSQLFMFALRRDLHLQLHGCLAVLEDTAWKRFQVLVNAADRLNLPRRVVQYQELHSVLDEEHGEQWRTVVLAHLVQSSPAALQAVCEGVLMRVEVAAQHATAVMEQLAKIR